jgi:hypothetical protein
MWAPLITSERQIPDRLNASSWSRFLNHYSAFLQSFKIQLYCQFIATPVNEKLSRKVNSFKTFHMHEYHGKAAFQKIIKTIA